MTPLATLIGLWIFWFAVGAFAFRFCAGGVFACIRHGLKAKFHNWLGFFFLVAFALFVYALINCP
jgi:hypothetical protein